MKYDLRRFVLKYVSQLELRAIYNDCSNPSHVAYQIAKSRQSEFRSNLRHNRNKANTIDIERVPDRALSANGLEDRLASIGVSQRDTRIIVAWLAGYKQVDIAEMYLLSNSTVKRAISRCKVKAGNKIDVEQAIDDIFGK